MSTMTIETTEDLSATPKMNPAVKDQWVAALRSGDFEQTTGKLTDGVGYCCLGVLCELAVAQGVVSVQDAGWTKSYDGETHTLPSTAAAWAGLRDTNPTVPIPDEIKVGLLDVELDLWKRGIPLAAFNDGNATVGVAPRTFSEMADIIEEQL